MMRMKRFNHVSHFGVWVAIGILLAPGCLGVSQNPFRIGNLPAGNIVRTHAKPPLHGYYNNFDRRAQCLSVTPMESTNAVRSQHVLVASICDKNGNGLRNRRVEWHVSGVGHIVEVDESGFYPGRGYMVDNKYAVSYTNYRRHTLTRGNDNPADDIQLRPGQTFCVITSAEEGDTHVTVYAPGIYDWDNHKVFAIKHWVDAQALLPPSAVNPAGHPHTLTTFISRSSDGTPAAGYRVRYRILDGPPAVLDPGGAAGVEVVSGPDGNASAILRQLAPAVGMNRVAIEIVKPAETATGKEVVVARGEMTKTWVSPQLHLEKVGPPTAVVGQPITYQITAANTGSAPTSSLTIRDSIPPSLQLVGSNPPATVQGENLIWQFGAVNPGQTVVVQFTATPTAAGTLNNCAEALLAEGIAARSCATTQVLSGALTVVKEGPAMGIVGQPIEYRITVTNPGNAPASNVTLTDAFDSGLVHQSGAGPLQLPIGTLAPGESRTAQVILVAQSAGRFMNRVVAQADGGLQASAEHAVDVAQPSLVIQKSGPASAIVGGQVSFDIRVANTGPVPATNVVVRDQLPPQLALVSASHGAMVQGNLVQWNLGTLPPGQEMVLQLNTRAVDGGSAVCNVASVTADGVQQQTQACVAIRGVPALLTEMIDRLDPVQKDQATVYLIQLTNQGSTPLNGVRVECTLPEQLEFMAAEGATSFDVQGNTVRFAPFNNMEPRKRLVYQIQARAVRPGKVRVRLAVYADELNGTGPIIKEESTTIYDPVTGEARRDATRQVPDAELMLPADNKPERKPSDRRPQADQGAEELQGPSTQSLPQLHHEAARTLAALKPIPDELLAKAQRAEAQRVEAQRATARSGAEGKASSTRDASTAEEPSIAVAVEGSEEVTGPALFFTSP